MRFNILFVVLLGAVLLASVGFASPVLQIQNYTTSPNPIYADTLGYLQVTLNNVGDATAYGATATYDVDGVSMSNGIGDITVNSNVQVTVPFHALAQSAGGIQVVQVDFYYVDQTATTTGSTSSSSKRLTLQVPVSVLQINPLIVKTMSIDQTSISGGESVGLDLNLTNTGGIINNLAITTPANSSFSLDGTSQEIVGTIASNTSQTYHLSLLSSSTTPTGTYNVPLVFTFYDRLNRPTNLTISIGPVHVQDTSTQIRLIPTIPNQVEIGSQATLRLMLVNTGSQPMSAIVEANSTSIFTPIGTQRLFFDNIAAGANQTQEMDVGVSASAAAGYYALPITITPGVGSPVSQSIGLSVSATPQLTISLDNSASPAQVTIANTGNSPIRSVDVTVSSKSQPNAAPVENFVGTLNVDDYSTVTLASTTSGVLTVDIQYRDSSNVAHSITQQLDAGNGIFSGTLTNGTSRSGSAANGFGGRSAAGGGLLGGLLGGGRPSGTTANSGLPIIPIVAKQPARTLRTSPDGNLSRTKSPSFAWTVAKLPALRAIWPPLPSRISIL